jgi:hypothetical protein
LFDFDAHADWLPVTNKARYDSRPCLNPFITPPYPDLSTRFVGSTPTPSILHLTDRTQPLSRIINPFRAQHPERVQPLGLSGQIQTAFIERLNLTLRHLVAALRRRTWALAHTGQGLRWRVALAAGYYNFCRSHQALRVPTGDGRLRRRTPAMALGVTGHRWTVQEFILHPVYG